MPYFSRLTDIVTCNLTALLEGAPDPAAALAEIVREIEEGVTGANRSATTAARNAARLAAEIEEQRQQVEYWMSQARKHLADQDDDMARQALFRKREVEDLVAALIDQQRAAQATREHLTTMLHALQARLADAERRLGGLQGVPVAETLERREPPTEHADVDAELERLRKELQSGRMSHRS
jgi:phage shock protein A